MDTIFIDDIRLALLIGVYPHEKLKPQTVNISLLVGTSTQGAGVSDNLVDTIDYAEVVTRLRENLQSMQFNLLERLAEYVASLVLGDFRADWVRVSIEKVGILAQVGRVGVSIERSRKSEL